MQLLTALISGLLFGIGLILSGLTDPSKVIAFLDLAGDWNPSLVFVMGGAILVGMAAFGYAEKRRQTFLGNAVQLPTARRVDQRLIFGGLTFGVGWGLAGYCPGPAVVSLASGNSKPLLFVAAMLAGMALFEILERITGMPRNKAA